MFDFDTWKQELKEIPDDLLTPARWAVTGEQDRRRQERATEQAQAALLEELRATGQLAANATIPAIPLVPATPITPDPPSE